MNQATQMVTIREPRAVTRIVYGNAIRAAVTETERAELMAALTWYEHKWHAQDAQAVQEARREQGQVSGGDGAPRKFSAVEKHGVGSPQAQAAQEARRAARAEAKGQQQDAGDENDGHPPA